MSLTPAPNPLPSRTMAQDAFDQAMAAFMSWYPTHISELDAFNAAITATAAGAAFAIPYTFSTTTTDADPTAGKLRLNNATQNAATAMRLDLTGAEGTDWTSVIDSFAASTSIVKGQIRLVKVNDGTKWLAFNVMALASPSGYRNLTVAIVGSSAASPFADGDSLLLLFTRTGDRGDTVTVADYMHVRDEKAIGAAGGSSVAGMQVRTLNTVVTNTIPGASLASDLITLPDGTYRIHASAPAYGNTAHKASLYNHSTSNDIIAGTNEFVNNTQSRSFIFGRFTLTTTRQVKLNHYIESAQTGNGLGYAVSLVSGQVAVFGEVEIWKEA